MYNLAKNLTDFYELYYYFYHRFELKNKKSDMNANSAKIQAVIEALFSAAIDKLTQEENGSFLSDIYVQVDRETGELQIFDEEENLVEKNVIFDWVNNADEEDAFNKRVAATLKAVLTVLQTKGAFEKPCFMKPFSVSLTDEDFVVVEELLFIDEDLLRLDDPFLKNLDEELKDFLDKLLPDME